MAEYYGELIFAISTFLGIVIPVEIGLTTQRETYRVTADLILRLLSRKRQFSFRIFVMKRFRKGFSRGQKKRWFLPGPVVNKRISTGFSQKEIGKMDKHLTVCSQTSPYTLFLCGDPRVAIRISNLSSSHFYTIKS